MSAIHQPPPQESRQDRQRGRRRRAAPIFIGVVLLAVGLAGTLVALHLTAAPPGTLTDMDGRRVVLDPGVFPNAGSAAKQDATDSGQGRFEVPSVGLDVPLGALNAVDGEITPPGITSVYWVRNYGVSLANASKGTVFVVTHSLHGGGRAPGNYLIDVQQGKSAVPDGATVIVDGVRYTVDGSSSIRKPLIASDTSVWENTPNRLVIITCLQVPGGTTSFDNMVITATRDTDR